MKRLMLASATPFDAEKDMPQERDDQQHIERIWQRYQTYRGNCHQ
ncbi:hypothetical protein [Erwinia amylovora]|nr:hypothetical protein [Erwinia amylovora]